MTLHAAIEKLLKFKAKPMSIQEIADELNANGWYQKKNGTKIQAVQIHGRTRNYKDIFLRKGTTVSLVGHVYEQKLKPKSVTAAKTGNLKPAKPTTPAKPSGTKDADKTPFIKPVKKGKRE
ncbi:MAG TPA: HTH domain-containing protein [Flavobacterium sp.]|nr:HTH domain-containing protein [Flavobacterium sp.]